MFRYYGHGDEYRVDEAYVGGIIIPMVGVVIVAVIVCGICDRFRRMAVQVQDQVETGLIVEAGK